MYIVANSKKGRYYLVTNQIVSRNLGIRGEVLGYAKLPQSLRSKRIFVLDEMVTELNQNMVHYEKLIRHLQLKIKNCKRDIKLLKGIEKRVGVALCGASSATERESGSSKTKRKRKKPSSGTSK